MVVMMVVVVVIMAIVAVMVTVARHRSAHDRAGPSAHDSTHWATNSRSGRTSNDSSANRVFTSRCARRRGECNTKSSDENRNAHEYLPLMIVDPDDFSIVLPR